MKRRTRRKVFNLIALTVFGVAIYLNFVKSDDYNSPIVPTKDISLQKKSTAAATIAPASTNSVTKN